MIAGIWLLIAFAVWITLTTMWAEVPQAAWATWDWAFKTVCFAAFLPFLIRSRTHAEALLLVIAFSLLGNTLAFATKVAISGGGYGLRLGLVHSNFGLGEGSSLATVAVSFIPVLMYLRKHSRFFPSRFITDGIFYTAAAAAIVCSVGTYERTGLIAIAVMVCLMWWNAKKKILGVVLIAGALAGSTYFVSDTWSQRMSTISSYQSDTSALGRLAVWMWTIDYVASHPLGGGFEVYLINSGTLPVTADETDFQGPEDQKEITFQAKAFHSIYFEVLGEHGYIGAALFGAIILAFFGYTRRIRKLAEKNPELEWASDLAKALRMSLIIYLCGGAFVGIAFQPYFYHIFACTMAISEYMVRVTTSQRSRSLLGAPAFGAAE